MKPFLIASALSCMALLTLAGQDTRQALQQKFTEIKESAAANGAALRQYTWTEHTDLILKGDVKSTKDQMCRYGPDGQVQKTEIGSSPQKQLRGVRGKIVEKKKGELEDYMERAVALIHNYVPPSPQGMQQAYQGGNVSLVLAGAGNTQLVFKNYVKPGDTMTVSFDPAARMLRALNVNSYLDDPKDIVTLEVTFQTLPDGTRYSSTTTLDAAAKHLQVRTENANYQKIAG